MISDRTVVSLLFVICLSAVSFAPSLAQLTLCPAPAAAGWTQSTFATDFPNRGDGDGPNGIAFTDDGKVIVADISGTVYIFPSDADNQVAGSVTSFNYGSTDIPVGLARIGPTIYMSDQLDEGVLILNQDGSPGSFVGTGIEGATGLTVNPKNKHLIVSEWNTPTVVDLNPLTGVENTLLTSPANGVDGVTTNGTILYFVTGDDDAAGPGVAGFNLSTDNQVFDSGKISSSNGVIMGGSGVLLGKLFVNGNDGNLFQIDLNTKTITLIASNGSRGDVLTIDPNGSLLVTQTDRIIRLTPPPGSTFEKAKVTANSTILTGGQTTQGTITLSSTAPKTMLIQLSSSAPSVTVPASVSIQAGSLGGVFTIKTSAVTSTRTVAVRAKLNGITSTVTLTINP